VNIVAWILQVLLALFFLFHFVFYTFSPEALVRNARESGQWPPAIPEWFRRFIGVAELLGAIGLIAPAVTGTLPGLVSLAALGLAIVSGAATAYHMRRDEPPTPIAFLVLALGLAYVRWRVVPL
jgi:hypothetical protein